MTAVQDMSAESVKGCDLTGANFYTDLEEMFDKEKLDAVIVATPPAHPHYYVGMLLATPITAILKILLERFDLTEPLGRILAGRLGPSLAAEAADSSADP